MHTSTLLPNQAVVTPAAITPVVATLPLYATDSVQQASLVTLLSSSNYFNALNVQERHSIAGRLLEQQVPRRTYLLREQEICRYMFFILKGSMRLFTINSRGDEHIRHLATEGSWVVDMDSFISQAATRCYIETMEDCSYLAISKASFDLLLHTLPAFTPFVAQFYQQNLAAAQQRLYNAISMPAASRVAMFMEEHPEWLQRFSQTLIAAYLGITPETFSRLRKQINNQLQRKRPATSLYTTRLLLA